MYNSTHTHLLPTKLMIMRWKNMKRKILLGLVLLFLIIGIASAVEFKDTSGCAEDFNELWIEGKKVANITEYNDTSFIEEHILTDNPIIKHITKDGANEVSSVSDYKDVYEFLTDNGFYYTFGKDGKYYVVTINQDAWSGSMLKEMDTWCLENSK